MDCCDIADYNEEAVFVLPAANWISASGWAVQKVFLPLRDKNVRLAAIGLGIQGGIDETSADIVGRLSKDTILALKILSDHSVSIGVRGEMTASVLEKLGIHNCKVIGCPSFYEPYRSGIKTEMNYDAIDMERIVCGMTPGIKGAHKVLELAYDAKNMFVLQAMVDLPLSMMENRNIDQVHVDSRFPNTRLSREEIKLYIKRYGKIFYTRKSWSEYLREQKISFAWGSRFHGNMMALSNGIPALWVVHDARTKEMTEAMSLPYITCEALMEIRSVEELIHRCKYDNAFWKSYKKMSQAYIEFLDENKINHVFNY